MAGRAQGKTLADVGCKQHGKKFIVTHVWKSRTRTKCTECIKIWQQAKKDRRKQERLDERWLAETYFDVVFECGHHNVFINPCPDPGSAVFCWGCDSWMEVKVVAKRRRKEARRTTDKEAVS